MTSGGLFPTDFRATYDLRFSVALATAAAPVQLFVEPGAAPVAVREVFDRIAILDDAGDSPHGVLEVLGRDGHSVRQEAAEASGSPDRPLSRAALLAKVWELYEFAGRPTS